MSEKIQAPKGTFDVLPADAALRDALVERIAAPAFDKAGYGRIDTPIFEDTALFSRGVGESTDVVSKEMYTFLDHGDRSITLRPEGTAPVCRAYVEHGMHKLPQPVKLWYHGPFFRQEAPQAARFRQFFQIGAEAVGSDDPMLDAESVVLLARLLEAAGATGTRLRISSLGSPAARAEYVESLKSFLRENESQLSGDVVERIDQNPLRAFDAKHEGTQNVMQSAPRLIDAITAEDREHFDTVLKLLETAGVSCEIDSTLVRGLDYYSRTVFEFTSDRLGAQSGVGGGGRYDGLVELLGGQPAPAIGWACGVERVLAAAEAATEPAAAEIDAYVALDAGADHTVAFALLLKLREVHGLDAQIEVAGRSIKGQLKQASRTGAKATVIFGGERAQYDAAIKLMKTGEQVELDGLNEGDYIDRIAEHVLAEVKR